MGGVSGPLAGAEGITWVRPNPALGPVEIGFTLGRPGPVTLRIHDVLGRQVRTLARGQWRDAGPQSIAWDGRGDRGGTLPAGFYIATLRTRGGESRRTLIRIR